MNIVLIYAVTIFMIVVSVFLSLYFSPERRRKFEKKRIVAFHICNVLFILMASSVAHIVMTISIIEDKSKIILQLAILLFTTLSFYILGNVVFEHYKFMLRKYVKAENGKVLILNKEYLKRK